MMIYFIPVYKALKKTIIVEFGFINDNIISQYTFISYLRHRMQYSVICIRIVRGFPTLRWPWIQYYGDIYKQNNKAYSHE